MPVIYHHFGAPCCTSCSANLGPRIEATCKAGQVEREHADGDSPIRNLPKWTGFRRFADITLHLYKFVFLIFWDSYAFESWFVSECVQGLEMQSHENSVFKEMLCPCFLQRQPFHARNFLLGSLASFPNSAIMKKHVAMLQYDSSLFDFFVVN